MKPIDPLRFITILQRSARRIKNMKGRPTWAEVDLSVIRENVERIKGFVGDDVAVMPVLKADGYGHGILETAQALEESSASFLGVAILDEGAYLRDNGIKKSILIFGCSLPEQAEDIVEYGLSQTVSSMEIVRALSRASNRLGKPAKIHVKIDTGMGRVGIFPEEVAGFLKKALSYEGILFEGILTHYPMADERDDDFTLIQLDRFHKSVEMLRREGINIPLRHTANSAAVVRYPETHLDMVRPGLLTYGVPPIEGYEDRIDLTPAMTLKTRVVQLRRMPKGCRVSYGRTYELQEDTIIATLPVGYADGYSRGLSSNAEVLIRGHKAPVVGRICMDQCLVDVGRVPGVELGDEVVLIGEQNGERITVGEVAERMGSISHEIMTTIGKRVPRVYLNNGRPVEDDSE